MNGTAIHSRETAPFRQNEIAMDLTLTLQRLYDSEINVTITMLWDGGFDFALISFMEWEEAGRPLDYGKTIASVEPIIRPDRPNPWHSVGTAEEFGGSNS